MNLNQIKSAVESGKKVFWANTAYEVVKDNLGQWLIIYRKGERNENCIGLTWRDGVTLNGREEDFFTE